MINKNKNTITNNLLKSDNIIDAKYINKKMYNLKRNSTKYNQNSNIGFYIPYSIIDSNYSYESLSELSFMIRNDTRSNNYNNMFSWNNILDNKINRLIFIYLHIVSIPLYPWLNCTNTTIDENIIETLLKLNLKNDDIIIIDNNIICISYVDLNICDFSFNYDYSNCYSLDLNQKTVKLYNRSDKKIIDEPFLYVDIDQNNNLNDNKIYETGNIKFNFKITPITISEKYVYYKGLKQYILKSLNEVQTLENITINIYSAGRKLLSNTLLNNNLYKSKLCSCIDSVSSCYCNYIRHPSNPNNQIDISFKIGQINNELITNVFN
jgi:hypothetical protein